MKEQKGKIRIKDIAVLAGVSEGTVDRVLHKRGDVSAKSLEAVNKVLEDINYTPNFFARSLASKKQFRFVCFFPEFKEFDYWHAVSTGFEIAAKEFANYNVLVEMKCFNQFDSQSFVNNAESILATNPDAVLIAPIFRDESLKFISQLSLNNIPFSFIDSMLEDTNFITYYGQHSFQSGYIAAKFSLEPCVENSQILVVTTKRNGALSNQTIGRYNGFVQYIIDNEYHAKVEVVKVELIDNDDEFNNVKLNEIFNNYHNIRTVVTFNSKVFALAEYLEKMNKANIKLIGYDNLEQNVEYLKKGHVSYIIAQRPEKQSYLSVRDMCNYLVFNQEVRKVNYVPIDVLMKENVDYYMDFRE